MANSQNTEIVTKLSTKEVELRAKLLESLLALYLGESQSYCLEFHPQYRSDINWVFDKIISAHGWKDVGFDFLENPETLEITLYSLNLRV